jgi:hypothetical protein
MSTKTTLVLALAAGFLGGIASQHIALPPVFAQSQTPIPTEIRAQSFVIVDGNGKPRGAFGVDRKGDPMIELTDQDGYPMWTRWTWALKGGPLMLHDKSIKPHLVPAQ